MRLPELALEASPDAPCWTHKSCRRAARGGCIDPGGTHNQGTGVRIKAGFSPVERAQGSGSRPPGSRARSRRNLGQLALIACVQTALVQGAGWGPPDSAIPPQWPSCLARAGGGRRGPHGTPGAGAPRTTDSRGGPGIPLWWLVDQLEAGNRPEV